MVYTLFFLLFGFKNGTLKQKGQKGSPVGEADIGVSANQRYLIWGPYDKDPTI